MSTHSVRVALEVVRVSKEHVVRIRDASILVLVRTFRARVLFYLVIARVRIHELVFILLFVMITS